MKSVIARGLASGALKAAIGFGIVVGALALSACSPRFGHMEQDPSYVPVGTYKVNDARYPDPTVSSIPATIPVEVSTAR